MVIRIIAAIATVAVLTLGLILGVRELMHHHWYAGIAFICSVFLTIGLIARGKEFVKESVLGAILAAATATLGFYSFLFENRALDISLDDARTQAALALNQVTTSCKLPGVEARFKKAAIACRNQSNLDKQAAVGAAARQAYVPVELDLIDKTTDALKGDLQDSCEEQFTSLYKDCPASFSTLSREAIHKLTAQD